MENHSVSNCSTRCVQRAFKCMLDLRCIRMCKLTTSHPSISPPLEWNARRKPSVDFERPQDTFCFPLTFVATARRLQNRNHARCVTCIQTTNGKKRVEWNHARPIRVHGRVRACTHAKQSTSHVCHAIEYGRRDVPSFPSTFLSFGIEASFMHRAIHNAHDFT